MKIPTIQGVIDRRILINFAVDKDVLTHFLPRSFKPKLINGNGMAGICLIRLKNIRPLGFPALTGIGSENAAHRIAVEWTENGQTKQGVYIPRRDTNSILNYLAGGRLFPGVHHLAKFKVDESEDRYAINVLSRDTNIVSIAATKSQKIWADSVFGNIETASDFFKNGSVGLSPNKLTYDGLELNTTDWKVEPLQVESVKSSFFENENFFPKGSVKFDNALLMHNIRHTWKSYQVSSFI